MYIDEERADASPTVREEPNVTLADVELVISCAPPIIVRSSPFLSRKTISLPLPFFTVRVLEPILNVAFEPLKDALPISAPIEILSSPAV